MKTSAIALVDAKVLTRQRRGAERRVNLTGTSVRKRKRSTFVKTYGDNKTIHIDAEHMMGIELIVIE